MIRPARYIAARTPGAHGVGHARVAHRLPEAPTAEALASAKEGMVLVVGQRMKVEAELEADLGRVAEALGVEPPEALHLARKIASAASRLEAAQASEERAAGRLLDLEEAAARN